MRAGNRIAIATAIALVGAGGLAAGSAAASGASAASGQSSTYFAFDVNNDTTDPGFVPVAGSSSSQDAQGDEIIVNGQLTKTHEVGGGYPIIGHDSGVCTFTRVPETNAQGTYADCTVTAVLPHGSMTTQGVLTFHGQTAAAATFAVTGGTGTYRGAVGAVRVSFTKNYEVLAFDVKAG